MSAHGNGNGRYSQGQRVMLDRKIVNRYRSLEQKTKIPIARMIEHAMELSIPMFEAVAVTLDPNAKVEKDGE